MPRSARACRAVGNARQGPSSVRWVAFAIIAAHISRADNVLRNDRFRCLGDAADEELVDEMGAIIELTERHVAQMPEIRTGAHVWIDRALEHSANKSLGEVPQIEGADLRPPIDALAEATWTAFRTTLSGPQPERWMDALLAELLDEYERIRPELE